MHPVPVVLFTSSLVDGGGLQTFLCDPMHTLHSSGYTLSGIYIDDQIKFLGKYQLGDQFISLIYTIRCAHPRKKAVLAAFFVVIHQTIGWLFKVNFLVMVWPHGTFGISVNVRWQTKPYVTPWHCNTVQTISRSYSYQASKSLNARQWDSHILTLIGFKKNLLLWFCGVRADPAGLF